jgi:hypothetical protein
MALVLQAGQRFEVADGDGVGAHRGIGQLLAVLAELGGDRESNMARCSGTNVGIAG